MCANGVRFLIPELAIKLYGLGETIFFAIRFRFSALVVICWSQVAVCQKSTMTKLSDLSTPPPPVFTTLLAIYIYYYAMKNIFGSVLSLVKTKNQVKVFAVGF